MGSKRRSSDIISLLVSIYGSKEIFIDEYRGVLADRLLQQLNYNTARYDRSARLNAERQRWCFEHVGSLISVPRSSRRPVFCVFREIRNVELLKLRFGESHMHYCEVMLKVNIWNMDH